MFGATSLAAFTTHVLSYEMETVPTALCYAGQPTNEHQHNDQQEKSGCIQSTKIKALT
jgi:hypothetical protein